MARIGVFCSSRDQISPMIMAEATALGRALAERGHELGYGGAESGAMGAIAGACWKSGGSVTGVFPRNDLQFEKPHTELQSLIYTESMYERKQKLAELSDGFVIFPGGTGTLDEFFEVLVLKQISAFSQPVPAINSKPIVVLNLFQFWDPLLEMLQIYTAQGFIDSTVADHYHVRESVTGTLEVLSEGLN